MLLLFNFALTIMTNRIINDPYSDYHIHSVLSDGTATIEEIVQYAGKIGMKEIAITDHSDFMVEILKERCGLMPSGGARYALNSRENVHNEVKVIF
jgi:histidinol phosphatase-like PHP family hydrolase